MIEFKSSWSMPNGAEYLSLFGDEKMVLWGRARHFSLWKGFDTPKMLAQSATTLETYITSISIHPEETVVVSGRHGGVMEVWRLPELTLESQKSIKARLPLSISNNGYYHSLGALTFTPDGRLMGGREGFFLSSPPFDDVTSEYREEYYGASTLQICFHRNQKHFAVEMAGDVFTVIRFGKLSAKLEVWEDRLLESNANTLSKLAFNPDGTCFAFGDWDLHLYSYPELKRIHSFKPSGERLEQEIEEDPGYIKVVWSPPVFLPHAPILICGSPQGVLLAWDITTGELLHQVQAHEGGIRSLVFDVDSQRLISAGADKLVKVWQVTL
jgi:WD40 repeat protein